jgi:hypothetical protein
MPPKILNRSRRQNTSSWSDGFRGREIFHGIFPNARSERAAKQNPPPHPYFHHSVLLLPFFDCPLRGCLGHVGFLSNLRPPPLLARGASRSPPTSSSRHLQQWIRAHRLLIPPPPWMLDLISLTSISNGIHCILDGCVCFRPFACSMNGIRCKLECVLSPMSMNGIFCR